MPSKLEGKPVPAFDLGPALDTQAGVELARPCDRTAAPAQHLRQLVRAVHRRGARCSSNSRRAGCAIDGIAIRDTPEDVAAFLARNGDPYERIGSDPQSEVQIALGSSGVPETFVIDGKGIIRYQHIGPIEPGDVPMILQKLEQAR